MIFYAVYTFVTRSVCVSFHCNRCKNKKGLQRSPHVTLSMLKHRLGDICWNGGQRAAATGEQLPIHVQLLVKHSPQEMCCVATVLISKDLSWFTLFHKLKMQFPLSLLGTQSKLRSLPTAKECRLHVINYCWSTLCVIHSIWCCFSLWIFVLGFFRNRTISTETFHISDQFRNIMQFVMTGHDCSCPHWHLVTQRYQCLKQKQ